MSISIPDSKRAAEIRNAVKSKYKTVSSKPEGNFPYPVGKESLQKLEYDPVCLEFIPDEIKEHFVGVGNPFSIINLKQGNKVLDAGCGSGLDSFAASLLAGPRGRVCGVDMTQEMLTLPRYYSDKSKNKNLEFYEASIEALPFEDNTFDVVISNGVLNLVPDKKTAFSELARVLKSGGVLAAADLVVMEEIPPEVLESKDAWST